MPKLADIKPKKWLNSSIKNKLVLSGYEKRFAIKLDMLDRKLRLTPQRAEKLFGIIESSTDTGKVRRAVYLFHLGRGSTLVSKKLPKGSCYSKHLRMARIERNIKPFGVIGTTNQALLQEIRRLGDPTKPIPSKLQRLCWLTAEYIAETSHQRITLDLVKKVVDNFLELYPSKKRL